MPEAQDRQMKAVIDIGSSSVKYAIYDFSGALPKLLKEADPVPTRLGRGLAPGGPLDPEAKRLTLEALATFRGEIEDYGASLDLVAGTAAMRKTGEQAAFVEEIRGVLGDAPSIRVISADEEASWARISARTMLRIEDENPRLFVDPGGSSNDFALVAGETSRTTTIGFGMNDLMVVAPVESEDARVSPEAQEALLDYLRGRYTELGAFLDGTRPIELIGTSGAAISLGAVHVDHREADRQSRTVVTHDVRVSIDSMKKMVEELAPMRAPERREKHPCLPYVRAQIFCHGALVYIALLETLGLEELRINGYGMKLGGLLETS